MATDGTSNTLMVGEVVNTKDIAIYNGFEVVNTTSLDGIDSVDVDGRDFLVWQRGSSSAEVQQLIGISENINQSGTQYNEPDDTDLSYSVEILGSPATFAEYGILLAI